MILLDCTLSLQDTSPFACWRAAGYGDTLKNMSHGDFFDTWALNCQCSQFSQQRTQSFQRSWMKSSLMIYINLKFTLAFHNWHNSNKFKNIPSLWFTLHRFNYFYILLQPFGISRSTSGLEETGLVPPPRRTRSGDDHIPTTNFQVLCCIIYNSLCRYVFITMLRYTYNVSIYIYICDIVYSTQYTIVRVYISALIETAIFDMDATVCIVWIYRRYMRCRVQLHSVSPVCPKLMTSQKVLHSEPSVSDGFDGCFPACFRNCLLR